MCKGSFGGRQGQPLARPWHLLIRSLGLAALPPPSVRLLSTEAIAYLITISSSSIDSLCNSCSACLLPTVHPGNTPYIQTDPTPLRVVAGWQPAQAFFTILHFYLGRSRTLQQSRYTSRCLADRIRIHG